MTNHQPRIFTIDSKERRKACAQVVAALKGPTQGGAIWEVTIKEQEKGRSTQQNKFYWGVMLKLIADSTGDTPQALHEYFKIKFLKHEDLTVLDVPVQVYPTTTSLSVKEFTEYLRQVDEFARTFLGVYLPAQE